MSVLEDVVKLIAQGDLEAFDKLTSADFILSRKSLLPVLFEMGEQMSNAKINRAFKGLVCISKEGCEDTFASVCHWMIGRLRTCVVSRDWNEVKDAQLARFVAAHLLSVVKAQPKLAYSICGVEICLLYRTAVVHGASLSENAQREISTTVLSRIESMLCIMGRHGLEDYSCAKDHSGDALLTLVTAGASSVESTASFFAMLELLREVHLAATASHLELFTAMLFWLPGLNKCLSCRTALSSAVANAASYLPYGFLACQLEGVDGSPGHQWLLSVLRLASAITETHAAAIAAILVAALGVELHSSLERVMALWVSLFSILPADAAGCLRSAVNDAVEIVGDSRLMVRAALAQGSSIPESVLTDAPLDVALLAEMQTANGDGRGPRGTILLAAAAAQVAPEFLTLLLPLYACCREEQANGTLTLKTLFDLLTDPALLAIHPALPTIIAEELKRHSMNTETGIQGMSGGKWLVELLLDALGASNDAGGAYLALPSIVGGGAAMQDGKRIRPDDDCADNVDERRRALRHLLNRCWELANGSEVGEGTHKFIQNALDAI